MDPCNAERIVETGVGDGAVELDVWVELAGDGGIFGAPVGREKEIVHQLEYFGAAWDVVYQVLRLDSRETDRQSR